MTKQYKGRLSVIYSCAWRVLVAITCFVLASTAAAQQRIFISPAEITPDADGIVAFSIATEGIPEPGFSSYALTLRFEDNDAISLTDQIGAIPGFIDTANAPTDQVTCSAQLATGAPVKQPFASGVLITSGQGELVLNSKDPNQDVLCTTNNFSGNEGSYNCGVAGLNVNPQIGDGALIGYRCFVGPDVPEGTVISVIPDLLQPESGAIFLFGQAEPLQSEFASGQIIIGDIQQSDPPAVNTPLRAGDNAITGTSEPNASIRLFVNNTEVATTEADDNGNWNLLLATALAPGDVIEATATAPSKRESVRSAPITIPDTPINTPPVAEAGAAQTVKVGDTVTLDASGSTDANGDALTYSWSLTTTPTGSTATLSAPTAEMPTFVVDLPGTYIAQLIVNDGTVDSTPDTVTITTENSAPVAEAGPDQSVLVGETVTLDASASIDVDGDTLTYSWSLTSLPVGSAATLSEPAAAAPTFDVDLPGEYVAQLIVNDGTEDSAPDTVTITTENSAPVAEAGPAQTVKVGDTVTLNGSGSTDVDGNSLTYSWSLTTVPAESTAALSDPNAIMPTFDVDLPGEYIAQLIVNDGTDDSEPDMVTITTENSAPVAEAGANQSVLLGDTVTLDGSGSSDVDGDPLTYSWLLTTIPVGSNATLSDPAAMMPTFEVDLPGEYIAQLIVNDATVDSAPATVTITTENAPPVADAGPNQSVLVGDTINLDGSGSSDVDGDALTYFWSLTTVPAESTAALSDPNAIMPTFDVDLLGEYVAQLIVNDGTVDSTPATVTISTDNTAPVADAGPEQNVLVGDTVNLNGSDSSDVDGDPLTYSWSLTTVPVGSTAVLSNSAAVMPTFDVDLPGEYIAQLIVNDGTVDSAPATITITTENTTPVADAGPNQSVLVGDTVNLDGSGSSDVDGNPLIYSWSLIAVPAGSNATLSDPASATPTFDVDMPGEYVVQLIINDGTVDSAPDTVTISTENTAPVADAGPDQNVLVGDTVDLDGSGSSDVDGDPLTYSWSLTSVPTGSLATLSDQNAEMPTFEIDQPGEYVAQLIVNDGVVDSAPATLMIMAAETGNPPATPQNLVGRTKFFKVNLTWAGSDEAAHYLIFRRLDSEVDFMEIGQTEFQVFADSLPTGTESAEYYLVAENGFGMSELSEIVVTTQSIRGRR